MSQLAQNAASLCTLLLALTLITRLAPKNKMLAFTHSLAILVLLASAALSLTNHPWTLPSPSYPNSHQNQDLQSFVQDQYHSAAQDQCRQYLQGLLAAAGLQAKKILPRVNINEDDSIVFTGASLWFQYESDAQRARALLAGALGQEVEIEVMWDGA